MYLCITGVDKGLKGEGLKVNMIPSPSTNSNFCLVPRPVFK